MRNIDRLLDTLGSLPQYSRQAVIKAVGIDVSARLLNSSWEWWARDDQRPPHGDWTFWLLLSGRGSGKTRAGAELVRKWAQENPGCRIALVAPTAGDIEKTMIRGPSGLLSIYPPAEAPHWLPSYSMVKWRNSSIGYAFSAEEPDRLRGPQFHFAWCDELAAWTRAQAAWDMLMFALRLGDKPRAVITTTPRPIPLIKSLVSDERVHVTRASTFSNRAFLAPGFFQDVVAKYDGTRLGRQEIYGDLLDDCPDALFRRDLIDDLRVAQLPANLVRIVVGVDPPVTSGEHADECGIVVAGVTSGDWKTRQGFVLADRSSHRESPEQWARRVDRTARMWDAQAIVVEVNQGGELVTNLLAKINPNIRILSVHARRGKARRAEPIAALYEQGRIHHVGAFHKLEDQLCVLTVDVDERKFGSSPDRADAMVYALTSLMTPPQYGRSLGSYA